MPLVIGLNHETAPLDLRERLAFPAGRLPEILSNLKTQTGAEELVCLSTCNRTEVYAGTSDSDHTKAAMFRALERQADRPGIASSFYCHENENAIEHLFYVASGLNSMVIGEHEILGQVKQAYLGAQKHGFTGKLLNVLFQRSLYVGKRVRTETGLGVGSASVGSVAVGMAERIFGGLKDRDIMILGAGKMAEVTAKHLLSQKARSIIVANRTFDRACDLAREFGGTAMHFDEGLRRLAHMDIVICSTAAPHAVITPEMMRRIMEERRGRSLFLIDIAVPRDVDPAVNDIDNVYLYNVDDLQNIVAENAARHTQEIIRAKNIVTSETQEFIRWWRANRAGTPVGFHHKPIK